MPSIEFGQQRSSIAVSDALMFPELEFLEENCPLVSDDLFQSWSAELGIPLMPEGETLISDHDETINEGVKDILDFSSFKELGFNLVRRDSGLENDIKLEVKNEIKLEPESPIPLFPLSPSSLYHSESDDSDRQVTRCSMQEVLNCTMQDVSTKSTSETPLISSLECTSLSPQSPQSSLNVNANIMQRVKLIPVNKEDIKHTKYIFAKPDSVKNVHIQPVDVAQHIKDGKLQNTIILQDFTTFTQNANSQNMLYSSKLKKNEHITIPNINPARTETTAFQLPQNVKIISTMPNICPASSTKSCNDIVVTSKPISYTPFQIMQNKANSTSLIVKNEANDLVNLPRSNQECELKALKRQQRMIKNRESACLSRKKRKEYVSSLERQISELKEENRQLKSENTALKQTLTEMEDHWACIRGNNKYGNLNFNAFSKKKVKRNVAILLGMILMISFNINGFRGTVSQNIHFKTESDSLPIAMSEIRHSRTLLWTVDENDDNMEDRIEEGFNKSVPIHQPICPMYINQSESIRLDSELRRWIDGESDRDNQTASEKTKLETDELNVLLSRSPLEEKTKKKLYLSRDRKIRTMHKMIDISAADQYSNNKAVEVFSPILNEHASLFEALGRKDDTFYVVWFSGEHLLLPASRKNDTARPKMSLVLPAVSINGTFSTTPNHITMMQIDCEVTNTQLLHLQQSIIPVHLRSSKSANQSNGPRSVDDIVDSFTANITRNYKPYFMKGANRKHPHRKHFV